MATEEKPDTTLAVDLAAAGLSTVGIGATEGGEAWFIEIQSDYEKQAKSLKQASFNASQSSSAEGDDTVPAELALSFRESANMLKFAMTQRSGRNSPGIKRPSRMGFGEMKLEEPVVEVDEEATDEELFSAMQGQWVEVECLLRVQLRSDAALEEAVRACPHVARLRVVLPRCRGAHRLMHARLSHRACARAPLVPPAARSASA